MPRGRGVGGLRLQEVDARVDSAMLVGHEPAIEGLALMLLGGGADLERVREKFPTAAHASLAFQGSWGELAPGAAELVAFVKPRELQRS